MPPLELHLFNLPPNVANRSPLLPHVFSVPTPVRNQEHDFFPMPKLSLIKFSGDLKEWPSFWEWFQDATDAQQRPDWQKVTYFKSCLTGTAYQTISAFVLAKNEYQLVVKSLKEKYGSTSVIISLLYDELNVCYMSTSKCHFREFKKLLRGNNQK